MNSTTQFADSAPLPRRVWTILGPDKGLAFVYVVVSLAAAATEGIGISLLIPFIQPGGSANVLSEKPFFGPLMRWLGEIPPSQLFTFVAALLLAVIILRGVLLYVVQVINEVLPLRVQRRLMLQAYDGLINLEIGYLSRNKVGEISNAVSQLPVRISAIVLQILQAVFNLILIAVYVALMLMLSWSLTLATLGFFGIASLLLRKAFTAKLSRIGAKLTDAAAQNGTLLHETLNGLRLIRLSAAEGAMSRSFEANTKEMVEAKVWMGWVRSMPSPILSTAAGAFICTLLAAGNVFVGGGDNTASWIASILLFNVLVFRLLVPVSAVNTARHYLAAEISALHEFTRFQRNMVLHRQRSGSRQVEHLGHGVHFENVTFTYPSERRPAVANLSFSLEEGTMTALVGPSGAGKSTVASLLARLHDPDSGRILVGDTDLRDVAIGSWHRLIGYVSQDAFIFNDTLANNMRFVKPEATDAEIRRALSAAAADDIVEGMPQGLETILGDRGTRLSGGQVQRITLARVLLAEPRLLILDEATSSLDSITEAAIQRSLEKILHGRTVLAIAHRLSTIVSADKIVVLERGVLRQQGDHDFLRSNSPLYQQLLHHQVRGVFA